MGRFNDHIIILDLHNTLYDEVIEYGCSIERAIHFFFETVQKQAPSLSIDDLYPLIAKGHQQLGSDWDNDVWQHVVTELGIEISEDIIQETIELRQTESETLTKQYAYNETIETINLFKEEGAEIYLATEATANAAADAVRWLNMDGIFNGVYSWPFKKPYQRLEKSPQYNFPEDHGAFLPKPHALILANIILDIAKTRKLIPNDVSVSDIFETHIENNQSLSEITNQDYDEQHKSKIDQIVKAIQTKIVIKDSPYKEKIQNLFEKCFYVGDSFFKDGLLAQNVGIPFIHALYGKKIAPEDTEKYNNARQILYKVTGWPPYLLQLTQEAEKIPELSDQIKPALVCEKSLKELLEFI